MNASTSDKQSPHPQRTTFLSGREVLERSRRSLERAREALARAPREDPRSQLFCDSLDALQRDLSVALGRFFETAPNEVLEEQTQYTVEIPRELESEEPPESLEEAMRWSLSLTHSLRDRFQKLSESAIAESLRDSYANLVELVGGYEKRIARLSEGEHDL